MTEQLSLIPEKLISPKSRKVVLTDLPEDLSGPEPEQAFIDSVQKYGILQPIGLIDDEGKYRVAYGRRRIKAARSLELISIPALIYPLGWTPASVLTLIENTHRADNLAAKLEAIADLRLRATPEEICVAVGVSQPELNEAIKLLKELTPELQAAMKEGRIKTTTAKKAAKLPPEKQQALAKQEKIKGKDVDHYLQVESQKIVDGAVNLLEVVDIETEEASDKSDNHDVGSGVIEIPTLDPVLPAVNSTVPEQSWRLQAKPLLEKLLKVVPEGEELRQYLELLADALKVKH